MAKVKKDRSEFYPHEVKFTAAQIKAGSYTVPATEVVAMLEGRAHIMVPGMAQHEFLTWTSKKVRYGDLDFNYYNQRGILPPHTEDLYLDWRKKRATPGIGVRHPNSKRIEIVDGMQHLVAFALSVPENQRDDVLVPVTITVSADPKLAGELFYAANAAPADVSPYKLYTSELNNGDDEVTRINNAVKKAGYYVAHTGIKKRYAITHIGNLRKAGKYGGKTCKELTIVLEKMKARWPKELNLSTPLLEGLLELRQELKKEKLLTSVIFDDVMMALGTHFDTGARAWQACTNAFSLHAPNESLSNARRAMNGIIYIHNTTFPKKQIEFELSQAFPVPLMPAKFGLHKYFNKKSYETFGTFAKVCKTGDLRYVWAKAQASKFGLTPEQLYNLCVEADKCPAHGCKSTKFDWARGDNIKKDKLGVNTPSVDHIQPKSQDGKDELNNYQITCVDCNTILNSQVAEDHTRIGSLHIPAGIPDKERDKIIASMKKSEVLLIEAKKKYAKV